MSIILIDKTCSVHVTVGGLIHILVSNHLVLEADQGLFHVVVALPVCENAELGWLNLSISLVHAGQVNL